MAADEPPGVTLAYDVVVAEVAPAQSGTNAPLLGGWAGPDGPAIDAATWPRSPRTGQPLQHCLTIWLPESFRSNPDAIAVSVFQWHDELGFMEPLPHMAPGSPPNDSTTVGVDAFWSALATSRPHPRSAVVAHRDTGTLYALLYLNQSELVGTHQSRPAMAPPFRGEEHADQVVRPAMTGSVWLAPRDDPNAGVAPFGTGYQEVPDRYGRFAMEHLGGTLMNPDQAGAGRLSPFYLELNRIGGFDFAGGDTLGLDLGTADPLTWIG